MQQHDLDNLTSAIDRLCAARDGAAWMSVLNGSEAYKRSALGIQEQVKRLYKKRDRLSHRLYGAPWYVAKGCLKDKVEARRANEKARRERRSATPS